MMHEIGAEDRFTPSALDPDRELAQGVAVRRLDEHDCRDAMSIVDQFGLPRREYRQHAVDDEIPGALQTGEPRRRFAAALQLQGIETSKRDAAGRRQREG